MDFLKMIFYMVAAITAATIAASVTGNGLFALISFIATFFLLFYFIDIRKEIKKSNNSISTSTYIPNNQSSTNLDQIKLSHFIIASKRNCTPDRVKENYFNELRNMGFSYSELTETENYWNNLKLRDSLEFKMNKENTPAALLEKWTKEYKEVHL